MRIHLKLNAYQNAYSNLNKNFPRPLRAVSKIYMEKRSPKNGLNDFEEQGGESNPSSH